MKLDALALDALTEIFNLGAGQAAHALSQLAGEAVLLNIPQVQMLTKREIAAPLSGQGAARVCAVRQGFSGVVNTNAMLLFPEEQSLQLVQMMVGSDVPLEQLSEMEQEALAEIGNILLNSVLASMADMLHIAFESTLPEVELGSAEQVLCPEGDFESLLLSLQINFQIASREIQGYLVFLLDVESSDMLERRINTFLDAMQP